MNVKKYMKRTLTALCMSLLCAVAFAQTHKVTGTVVDTDGNPVVGANVLIVGTTTGVMTDAGGHFVLPNVAENATVVVSFIGYETQTLHIGNRSAIEVTLKEDTAMLDEVVVVGYMSQRKESLTGSMSTIKSDKLKDITTPSVENMLNGKVPGVYVAPGSGQPGSSGAVVIRGQATLSGSTAPLWVIDGVIVGSDAGQLNPADIESMTILKDAASTAVYGSQGANGVIVVTTKNPSARKMTVSASVKMGASTLNNGNLEVMNGAELYDYYASFQNVDAIKFSRWNPDLRNSNFDWWNLATKTGFTQDYNITLSGGSEKLQSMLSLNYYDEQGAVRGYDYSRYNVRMKNVYKPLRWLTIRPSFSGSLRQIDDRQYSVNAMYSMLPWDSPYDENGNLVPHYSENWVNSNQTNYLYDLQWNYSKYNLYEFMGNLDFDINITDWLTFSSVNNFKYLGVAEKSYTDPRSAGGEGTIGQLYEYRNEVIRRYTNQKLLFSKRFNKHSLDGVVAYEFNDYSSKTLSASGTGFIPGFDVLDVTAIPESVGGSRSEWAVQSFLTQWKYSYDNRILAEASYRADGASNFGDNAKYGSFFSLSAGWIISNERWFNVEWLSHLKIRASYGSLGNRPSSLYPQYTLYAASSSYDGTPGALFSQIGNKDLTWEKTYTTGVGIDANFLDNRLRLTFDYYNKDTDGVLYAVPVTGLVGVTSVWRNVGKVQNTGIELSIGADIIRNRDWLWNVEFNLGHNRNELRDLYAQRNSDGTYSVRPVIIGDGSGIAGSASRILEVGYPIDTYYMPEWAGVNPDNGAPMWYKDSADGNGRETTSKYAEAGYYKLGSVSPTVFGGFSTTLVWKNLDFNAVFGYSVGGKIFNYSRLEFDSDGAYNDRNQMKLQDGWSRWEKPGDIATHPVAKYNNPDQGNKASSRFLEDSSFLKLRSLTLGYNFRLGEKQNYNLRVYFTGENLFTITDYSGVDPELPASGGKVMGTTGVSVYPSVRRYMFGVNLNF